MYTQSLSYVHKAVGHGAMQLKNAYCVSGWNLISLELGTEALHALES